MYSKSALIDLVRAKALKFGDFTLASGKKASYFLDCKEITLDSIGAVMVGEGLLELIGSPLPDAVGGMSIGADPILASVITIAGLKQLPLLGVMVRKEPKDHGTKKCIEGPVKPGQSIVIVEDVVTTGGSSLKAIEHCEAFGLKVTRVLAIIDREEGGREAFESRGYPFQSLLSIRDFGITPPAKA